MFRKRASDINIRQPNPFYDFIVWLKMRNAVVIYLFLLTIDGSKLVDVWFNFNSWVDDEAYIQNSFGDHVDVITLRWFLLEARYQSSLLYN